MEDAPLQSYSRKTTFRVKFTDLAANIGIKTGGLAVILAVLGLIVFIFVQLVPLFYAGEVGEVREPISQSGDRALLIHADEYRRVAVRVNESGKIVVFALPTGEVIEEFKPKLLGDATISRAELSLRPRTRAKVAGVMDVQHFHLLIGTSDGRVLVGSVAYVTDFLRFENAEEEPDDLEALHMPSEEEFKSVDYMPDVAIREGKVVEHLTTFGFYRTIQTFVKLEREIDFESDGKPIRSLAGQIEDGEASDSRKAVNVVVTGGGKTLLVRESIEVNEFTDELEASARVDELTERLDVPPEFVLVNERMDRVVLANKDGNVHVFEWDQLRRRFDQPYPKFSVFGEQADLDQGRSWRDIVDEQRDEQGFEQSEATLELTSVNYLLGDQTVIFADSRGGLQAWFAVPSEDEKAPKRLMRVRTHAPGQDAIVSIEPSPINKAFLALEKTGRGRAIHNTAQRVYAAVKAEGGVAAHVSRKGDGIIVVGESSVYHWWLEAPHAEASLHTLFGEVWYEDFPEPGYEWQTSSGTDDVETKISLMPLILGTVKGALYALLFSVPLAVLAAVYTSEFMHRRLRSIFKPTMEVMASLPSVVLGALAALYFAPKAAPIMPVILVALVVVPGVFLIFGWLWQRCPPSFVGKFNHWVTTSMLFGLLFLGIWLSSFIGPRAEIWLFPAVEGADPALVDATTFEPVNEDAASSLATGNFRSWTDGGAELPRATEVRGAMLPKGWWKPGGHNLLVALLAIPLALLAGLGFKKLTGMLPKKDGRDFIDQLRHRMEGAYKGGLRAVGVDALFSLCFASFVLLIGFLLALAVSHPVEWMFFSYDHPTAPGGQVADFRRWITGPEGWKFEGRNSVIVGFAMGFAVIPIIYTIAEDALTSVPNQLRAASLACGASRWQTTMRVVMPAAIAGIFSGVVIGLGRALGETMIVLMAAGGTPVMEMQPLIGFRTLSAAIATEMPEAPHSGTLYRTLFLAGFVLFCMSFVMNTLAEGVRIRLRRKLSRL